MQFHWGQSPAWSHVPPSARPCWSRSTATASKITALTAQQGKDKDLALLIDANISESENSPLHSYYAWLALKSTKQRAREKQQTSWAASHPRRALTFQFDVPLINLFSPSFTFENSEELQTPRRLWALSRLRSFLLMKSKLLERSSPQATRTS